MLPLLSGTGASPARPVLSEAGSGGALEILTVVLEVLLVVTLGREGTLSRDFVGILVGFGVIFIDMGDRKP